MTTLNEGLAAPLFQVEVSALPDPATAEVPEYADSEPSDVIDFQVETSTGNAWEEKIQLSSQTFPLKFKIPKEIFQKGLQPGATANLYYSVWLRGVNPSPYSARLTLSLNK